MIIDDSEGGEGGCRRLVHCTLSLGPSHPFPRHCQISGFRNNPWGLSYRTLRSPRLLKLQVSVREAIPSPGLPSSMGPESQSVRSISKHDLVVHHHTDPLDALQAAVLPQEAFRLVGRRAQDSQAASGNSPEW